MLGATLQSAVMIGKMDIVQRNAPSVAFLGDELRWTAFHFDPPAFLRSSSSEAVTDDDEGIARLRKISLHYHAISRLAMGVPGRLAEAVEGKKLAAACEEAAETLTAGGHHEVEQRWLKLRCAARAVSFMKDEETRFIYRVPKESEMYRI